MRSLIPGYSDPSSKVVHGLAYIANYIAPDEETRLLACINAEPWRSDLKRRVQHYGFRYDYKARAVTQDLALGPMPSWVMEYCDRLFREGTFTALPDQVIVNEYMPGQGISAHIDCVPCFGETIASLSLSSSCVMDFARGDERVPQLLAPRSLIVFRGDARYRWSHGIAARKSDHWHGLTFQRHRRVSLTFRNVILAK